MEFPWDKALFSLLIKYWGLFLSISFKRLIWALSLANWESFCCVNIFAAFFSSSSEFSFAFCLILSYSAKDNTDGTLDERLNLLLIFLKIK